MNTPVAIETLRGRRVLVTGATGFAGGHLTRALAGSGAAVRVLVRRPDALPDDLRSAVEVIVGDIRDPLAVRRAIDGCELVYHIAAMYREASGRSQDYWDVNVIGTEHVLRACEDARVRRLIHCSTVGVHGNVTTVPSDETAPFHPDDPYQRSKLEAEQRVWAWFKRTGIPTVVIRPAGIYGPGDLRFLKLFRAIRNGRFVMLGNGRTWFHAVYIDDLVQAFLLAGTQASAVGETFIISGDRYISLTTLAELIAGTLHVDMPTWRLPVWPAYLAGAACEAACVPFGINPPLHRRRVGFFTHNRAFTSAKAERLLGYRFRVELSEGLCRTAQWYTRQGYLRPTNGRTPDAPTSRAETARETPDIETSSDDYARRFAGPVGEWFLRVQEASVLRLLAARPVRTILEVGGGHGQLTPALVRAGYQVTVLGSDASCGLRITPLVEAGRCRFVIGEALRPPYPDRAFDAVVSVRLLPHIQAWPVLIGELSRVAKDTVIVDFPTTRSLNRLTPLLFEAKRRAEGNTRPYRSFPEGQVAGEFAKHGFTSGAREPQFFWPMVLHRSLRQPVISISLEALSRATQLTRWFGSPVVARFTKT